MRQHLEEPSITTVANGNVNDLRWSAKEQRAIVEINVLTEDDEILYAAALPNLRVRRR